MEALTVERPYRCVTCHFPTLLDDLELRRSEATDCVCVRCYHHQTGSDLLMDKQWRRQWSDAVNDPPG